MRITKTTRKPAGQRILNHFKEHFDLQNKSHKSQGVQFDTQLHVGIPFKEGINLSFPLEISAVEKGMVVNFKFTLHDRKLIMLPIISALLLGGLFYLLNHKLIMACVFGMVLGLIFYFTLHSMVRKSFEKYVSDLFSNK